MEIWMVCVEMSMPSTDESSATSEIGFMNITTLADSQEMAEAKIQKCLESYGWQLISIDNGHIISDDREYGEPELDQIERTRGNPDAVILGTFHTYRTN
jgi:hypothetical protein